jgi:protein-S-isoprenylcysteine O-methyltransferase Ste14
MTELNKKAIMGLLRMPCALAILLFLPAWTLRWWQAWVFIAVFSFSVLAITLYLMRHDPALLARRMRAGPNAEPEKSQKAILYFVATGSIATILFPAIDHRFGWSVVPNFAVITGDVLIALGFAMFYVVFRENSFASSTVEIHEGQKVISTGPYALVRHPLYFGALVMLLGVPLALGSWWGLLFVLSITPVLAWRLLDEERFLAKSLPGYAEYRSKVRYRLLPFVW